MNRNHIKAFAELPPPRENFGFVRDLKSQETFVFPNTKPCRNVRLTLNSPEQCPEIQRGIITENITRLLKAKGIPEASLEFERAGFESEEFELEIQCSHARLRAGDSAGFLRAGYALEEKIRETGSGFAAEGKWHRKPFVRNRISRCFFGPTNRAPFFIDELTNDVDYYPDAYLDKLARDGVNGLWLTMYFKDFPSGVFSGRGADSPKRFAKLRKTVEKCARYGIRIFVFFSEPKLWGNASYAVPESDAVKAGHPELVGMHIGPWGLFCTSTETGKRYLSECVGTLFREVPGLGGIINIMLGEDNGSCAAHIVQAPKDLQCPLCSKRDPAEIFREEAELMKEAMKKYSPSAEFIGWFYAPGQKDGGELGKKLAHCSELWPDDCTFLLNFESGGKIRQLGLDRTVNDYSLAFVGPSELFRKVAGNCARPGAKLQVGCSHEDASVPFIPVPSNLFEKYRTMHRLGVGSAMQCWYFGNYPGLMDRSAGRLSFEPFPESEDSFLLELAKPDWRGRAPEAVRAWKLFAAGYREFPGNIAFEWFGPLHNSIVWPLHLFPEDSPIAPSWILHSFPEVSGDRIGECMNVAHTLEEALELMTRMRDSWRKGCEILEGLRPEFSGDPARTADLDLASAILLQIESTWNVLEFYRLREELFYDSKTENLEPMRAIVQQEISNSEKMEQLCRQDTRLGYHSEAENYLFFPEKLKARVSLLNELLEKDFPAFSLKAVESYTGAKPSGTAARFGEWQSAGSARWRAVKGPETLRFEVTGAGELPVRIELEFRRSWPILFLESTPGNFQSNAEKFRKPEQLNIQRSADSFSAEIPLRLFDGFRHEGFPFRVNVTAGTGSWIPVSPWPSRLIYGAWNPACAGWLL